ncbi:hypothetical protein G4B88_030091 [Cannabis sativa]|uniref:Uncharacterized protein n=1 Tax=Cannabis sativa TaxID=3483 RepID=A0A7J6DWM8_CANSA|nr:hypothetical protein G4B88_030091 [Cannabis sativa]
MVVLNLAKGAVRRFALVILVLGLVCAEDPYRFFDWTVSYGDIYPLGVKQRGILINGLFPGPNIYAVTNDNLIINVKNNLPEPFLLSWSGLQNRKNSYQDGVSGTTCAIPPGKNYTYKLQAKDQIGSFYYFPSTAFHKAAGGFGAIKILSRPRIPVPFPPPAADYSILIGDWYKTDHEKLKSILDNGRRLTSPDGILINGRGSNAVFTIEQGKTIRLRVSNVGLQNSLNFRIQGHTMKLIEVEGIHTIQTTYDSLDIHVGQSYSVLVTGNKAPQDYYIAVSTRFSEKAMTATAILKYKNSARKVSGPIPAGPNPGIDWSLNQARSIRNNGTASGPRPNPQGSYPYWNIPISRTITLESSAAQVGGKQRYAINSISYKPADTPLKLADYYKIPGVFRVGSMPDNPTRKPMTLDTAVLGADYRAFIEIIFQNHEDIIQSYHINGYYFRIVGMDKGVWSKNSRKQYNMVDAVSRYTTQVYPKSWTAALVALDNVGMWNVRSEFWARQYLGQQFYMRVFTNSNSTRDEYLIPPNALKSNVPAIFILGDSTADVGTNNFLPHSGNRANFPYNGIDFPQSIPTGRFSNGLNSADFLGANFASGGSGILDITGQSNVSITKPGKGQSPSDYLNKNHKNVIPLGEQIRQFSSVRRKLIAIKGRKAAMKYISESLYFLSIGSNDIFGYFHSQSSIPKSEFLSSLIFAYQKHLKSLLNLGAKKFGIISVPPIGCCPSQRAFNETGGGCLEELNQHSEDFHVMLGALLNNLSSECKDMKYSLGNAFEMTINIIKNPTPFNFTEVKAPCCGDGESFCIPHAKLCPNRHEYLFWDLFHPTETASELAAVTLFSGPPSFVYPINFAQLAEV